MSTINCLTNARYPSQPIQSAPQFVDRSEVNAAVVPSPNFQRARTGSDCSSSGRWASRIVSVNRSLGVVNTYPCNGGSDPNHFKIGEGNPISGVKVLFCTIARFSDLASLMKIEGS